MKSYKPQIYPVNEEFKSRKSHLFFFSFFENGKKLFSREKKHIKVILHLSVYQASLGAVGRKITNKVIVLLAKLSFASYLTDVSERWMR